jgi:hypothetical protein
MKGEREREREREREGGEREREREGGERERVVFWLLRDFVKDKKKQPLNSSFCTLQRETER